MPKLEFRKKRRKPGKRGPSGGGSSAAPGEAEREPDEHTGGALGIRGGTEEPPGEEEGREREFFELGSEEVAAWEAPRVTVPVRRRHDWRPFAVALCFMAATGVAMALAALLWPTSTVEVPDVVGRRLALAQESIRDAGLIPRVESWEYSSTRAAGMVVSQRPRGGSAGKGSAVSLTVSKGAPDEPAPAPRTRETGPEKPEGDEGLSAGPLHGKKVCIDPGHQALVSGSTDEWSDPGTDVKKVQEKGSNGIISGNPEHLINLDIAFKLKSLLEKDGVEVVMTRDSGDVDLSEVTRAEMANDSSVDLYVRIHEGHSPEIRVRGTRSLYPARSIWTEKIYDRSKAAALYIQGCLVRSLRTKDLGVEARDDVAAFNWSRVPVVQAEAAFLSNPQDDTLLANDDFRWKVAWGLRDGILRYLRSYR